ncbi:MAG: sulfatase-like hydrolase/transferase [Planctomycetes bacterium]|nr:sulfatase-like hydrolase/transferase [Planctomycetota bacterium]
MYEAEVRYQDRRLGEFLALLRERTDFDNTLLIISADHGENLGAGGRWEHTHAINDALIHVPLIIRFPKRFPRGTRVSGLCQNIDFVPTIYDVIGHDCPVTGLPGRSLVPENFTPYQAAFAQVSPYYMDFGVIETTTGFEAGLRKFNTHRRVLRTGDYKYIWSSDGKHCLYNVRNDPQETVNLVARKPELAQRLHQQLLDWLDAQPKYVPKKNDRPRVPLDDKTINRLRSLGYIGD